MSPPAYADNQSRFTAFRGLQKDLVESLARQPQAVQAWLDAQPPRETESAGDGGASRGWRAARLSTARRRELAILIAAAAGPHAHAQPLADWLLASMPVRTYLEMADRAEPSLGVLDPLAGSRCRAVAQAREALFLANYGLAKAAAYRRCPQDFGDRLSAASCGLLDAIDRYVPGEGSARFGYFATYWIRYHLGRQTQKHGSVVSCPINQHRISRRIDRLLAQRRTQGLPPPSEAEVRSELKLGAEAYYWHQRRPRVISLHRPVNADTEEYTLENLLCDPAPEPHERVGGDDLASRVQALLRTRVSAEGRVILAYTGGIGSLAEAATNYLAVLQRRARPAANRPTPRPLAEVGH